MNMPGRKYSATTAYRYGFNGKENDPEVEGQQDYGMRIYDARLMRFKSVDPLIQSYPFYTPYQFAANCPISGIDVDGKEFVLMIYDPTEGGKLQTMMENNATDIYELRKFTNKLLGQKFTKSEFDKLLDSNTPQFAGTYESAIFSTSESLNKAELVYNKNAPTGLTIEFNVSCAADDLGNETIWSKKKSIPFIDNMAYPDMGMPVDLRMIESPMFGNTYKDNDFVGTYSSTTTTLQLGPGVGGVSGTTMIEGVLKGYGYVGYSSEGVGPSLGSLSWSVSEMHGSITGKSLVRADFTPQSIAGWGSQISVNGGIEAIGVESGKWWSFDNYKDAKANRDPIFSGTFKGVGFSAGIGGKAGGGVSKQTTNTSQNKIKVTYTPDN